MYEENIENRKQKKMVFVYDKTSNKKRTSRWDMRTLPPEPERSFQPQSLSLTIIRASAIKILVVGISSNLSVCGHVNNVIASRAQTVHALRLLGSHGMPLECIYTVYRAIVVAKLTYASSAWYGLSTAADRQRLEAVIGRAIRSGLCDPDQLSLAELVSAADDLFFQVMYNDKHVLNCLLPAKTERTCQLRNRRHNRLFLAKV